MTISRESPVDFQLEFRNFVMREQFPCLGARATLGHDTALVKAFGALGDPAYTEALGAELSGFGKRVEREESPFLSFIAVFPATPKLDEHAFDALLWKQLQQIGECDREGVAPDASTSDHPEDPNFAFRFGGISYFVVGLTPSSSRIARRFTWPTLVFNPHPVFDRLRTEGKYERMKSMIRDREISLQGSLNPNLADFGEVSEARQYSGLVHPPEWKCPFHKEGT